MPKEPRLLIKASDKRRVVLASFEWLSAVRDSLLGGETQLQPETFELALCLISSETTMAFGEPFGTALMSVLIAIT